ncbi:MAG: hypothetical protein ACRCY4_05535 [Brevinema sp.]
MKKLILLVLLVCPPLFAQEFFTDFENLKPGTKGYAMTVFKGTEPERMELEIVDYIPPRLNALGMVLIKLNGANVEQSRVAAGMSGSPVYIDDKLVGALAYTWANARELMAGVTLIQDMISDGEKGGLLPFSTTEATPIQAAWSVTGIDDTEFLQRARSGPPRRAVGLEPTIPAPSRVSNGVSPFRPGDAVAIKLIEGDISAASIGTVTYVDGDKVYIYGHPMNQSGSATLPLAKAQIYTIIASTDISFKMGSATETVGATVFDGAASVYGRTDRDALMTPIKMNFRQGDVTKAYNFSVVRSARYLPSLVGASMNSLISKELGKNIERNITMSWKIMFTNGEQVSNSAVWTKGADYDPETLQDFWGQYTGTIWDNPISALVPEAIEFNVDVSDNPYANYILQDVRADRTDFFAGEQVTLRVALNRPQEGLLTTNVQFTIPKNIPQGQYTLYMGSPARLDAEIFLAYIDAKSLRTEADILRELRKPIDTQVLRTVLVEPKSGSLASTQFLENIPLSRRSLFRSQGAFNRPITSPKVTQQDLSLDRPLSGSASITINIIESKPIPAGQQERPQVSPTSSSNSNSSRQQ